MGKTTKAFVNKQDCPSNALVYVHSLQTFLHNPNYIESMYTACGLIVDSRLLFIFDMTVQNHYIDIIDVFLHKTNSSIHQKNPNPLPFYMLYWPILHPTPTTPKVDKPSN